jgi:hypothetical protein
MTSLLSDLADAFAECEMRGKTPHRIDVGVNLFQHLKESNWLSLRRAGEDGASIDLWFYQGVSVQEDATLAPDAFHMTVL